MTGNRSVVLRAVGMFAAVLVLAIAASALPSEQVIWTFTGQDGITPSSPLLIDQSGRLYGVTNSGGQKLPGCVQGCGVVFELASTAGTWNYRRLYAFQGGTDGKFPVGRIVFDAAGNLYGVTSGGGDHGAGAAFKLTRDSSGQYSESVIYSFRAADTGYSLASGLAIDTAGNLFGTARIGGASENGSVYELSPNSDGTWKFTVLYNFNGTPDGSFPEAEVILDASGNLFGTTTRGGDADGGTAFELSQVSGVWTESILHNFVVGTDSATPNPLWLDSSGNLFGPAFELTPNPDGSWTETVLHRFGIGTDGIGPSSGLVGHSGGLYGTTASGGHGSTGTVYELVPFGTGWKEPHVYDFGPFTSGDGIHPLGGVTFSKGVIYGVTCCGGSAGDGIVYQITP